MDTGLQWDIRVHLEDRDWRKWVSRTGRFLAVPMFMLLFMTTPAHAVVETMTPTGGGYYTLDYMGGSYSTPCAACEAWFKTLGPGGYAYNCSIAGDMDGAYCGARIVGHDYSTSLTARYVAATCPVPTVNPQNKYVYNRSTGLCERTVQDCPAHSSGTYPDACVCDAGYKVDAAKTSCVPITDTCPIPDLTPLTDPVAIDFDNNVGSRWRPDGLTADYQTKLKCVEDAIIAKGGTSEGSSAYRPEQYQRHLYEIVDKDFDLSQPGYMAAHPECTARRAKITKKMEDHGLKRAQAVAEPGTSRHESGTAFDLTPSRLTKAQLAPIYKGCGVTNKAVSSEPWHTQ